MTRDRRSLTGRFRSKLLATTTLAAIAGSAVAAGAGAGGHSRTPRALYEALLTKPTASKLPTGFHKARRVPYALNDQARRHHALGGVEIDIDRDAAIIYLVYATRADAVADWKETNIKQHGTTSDTAPGRFPWPAVIINYSIAGKDVSGKTVTNGVTDLAFTSRNVIVQALTMSATKKASGTPRSRYRWETSRSST